MRPFSPSYAPWILLSVALLMQGLWSFTIHGAFDWDSAAYLSVARHILKGEGAVSTSLWNLMVLPEKLPMPADLYWMPLPSRILLPGLALFSEGDRVINAILGAALAPLAWALATERRKQFPEIPEWLPLSAGLWAASGGMYARHLGISDSVALFGLCGGLGFLAVARQQTALAIICAALAALTRNDGFLLGIAWGIGLRSGWPMLSGLLAYSAWQLRNAGLVADWWQARAALSAVLSMPQLIRGDIPVISLIDRLSALGHWVPGASLMVYGLVLPFPAVLQAFRGNGWFRSIQAYFLGLPLIGFLLAPAIFAEGSFFRSSVALFPMACGLALEGLWRLSLRFPRYHPVFLVSISAVCLLALQLLIGPIGRRNKDPFDPQLCTRLQSVPKDAVIFSNHPPFIESFCGYASVILPAGLTAAQTQSLAERYDIHIALLTDTPGAGGQPDPTQQLPGWQETQGLWRRP
jgi:hypothetical protein